MNTKINSIDFAPDNVILNFRNNEVKPPIVRFSINEIVTHGIPLDSHGTPLKLVSVKLHDNTYNISISSPGNLSVHFVDNTSQNFDGFISELEGTLVESVTYHEQEQYEHVAPDEEY